MLIAVIGGNILCSKIISAVNKAGQVVYEKNVNGAEECIEAFTEVKRINCSLLVVDLTCAHTETVLQELKAYRLLKSQTRIIVVAPGFYPGNAVMRQIFSLGIYDIYAPGSTEAENFQEELSRLSSEAPKTIREAWRWYAESESPPSAVHGAAKQKRTAKEETVREKIIYRDRIVGTVVIAVGGTDRGVGCTHTSISLASFLAKRKYKAAVLELNSNPVFAVLNNGQYVDLGGFKLEGVDYFSSNLFESQEKLFGEVLQAGYNYLVLDLGCLKSFDGKEGMQVCDWYAEMLRADVQVLVSGGALWQLKNLTAFMPGIEPSSGWSLLFNFIELEMLENISRIVKSSGFMNCPYANPFCSDPFKMNEEREKVFSELLKAVLPQDMKKRKFLGLMG